jgi:hypothetical protein
MNMLENIRKFIFGEVRTTPKTIDQTSQYHISALGNPFWNEIIRHCEQKNFAVTNVDKDVYMEIITPPCKTKEADKIVQACGCNELLSENLHCFAETIHRKCNYQDKTFFVTIVDREIKR